MSVEGCFSGTVATLGTTFKRIRREKQFGHSVREETERRLYQIKHRILNAQRVIRWFLPPAFLLWATGITWLSYYTEHVALKHLPYWMLIFVLFGCVSLFSVGWLFKRIIKKLNPQQVLGAINPITVYYLQYRHPCDSRTGIRPAYPS